MDDDGPLRRQETHVHIHHDGPCSGLGEVLRLLRQIIQKDDQIMATLADLQASVTAEDTVIDSAMALLTGLAAQIAALAPNQAAIDALAADVTSKTAALSQAVAANTPAAP